jgi:hypothetical protein
MTRIYAKHAPYRDGHLGRVAHDMDVAGAPTIRAVRFKDELYALEGSHRLALTHERGVPPKIIVLEADTAGCEEFFERVRGSLPAYDFDHVLVLHETDF